MQFKIRKISNFDATTELKNIGFDAGYLEAGAKKHEIFSFKIFSLTPQQATILKQTAISVGSDCAVHRHVIDFKVEKSDCIITASVSQFEKLCAKLQKQPFSLKKLSEDIKEQVEIYKKPKNTVIMGILNLTSDSFSDGGSYLKQEDAILHAAEMIKNGAEIIDIGAESTAPGTKAVKDDIEIEKVVPIIKNIRANYPEVLISIDTRNSKTALAAVLAGADIINDVSGLAYDEKILDVAIETGKKLVITHSRGIPENMNDYATYENVVEEVYSELKDKCDSAISKGIKPENIIIDPGFGFAKNAGQNLELLKRICEFKSLGYEILVGVSRKRFLGEFSSPEPKSRDEITSTASFYLTLSGIDIIRVHNVELSVNSVKFAKALI